MSDQKNTSIEVSKGIKLKLAGDDFILTWVKDKVSLNGVLLDNSSLDNVILEHAKAYEALLFAKQDSGQETEDINITIRAYHRESRRTATNERARSTTREQREDWIIEIGNKFEWFTNRDLRDVSGAETAVASQWLHRFAKEGWLLRRGKVPHIQYKIKPEREKEIEVTKVQTSDFRGRIGHYIAMAIDGKRFAVKKHKKTMSVFMPIDDISIIEDSEDLKTISSEKFKHSFSATMESVLENKEAFLISKRGKNVAVVAPVCQVRRRLVLID